MKTCSRCCESKSAIEYGRDRARKDGLSVYCKTCLSAKSSAYYNANQDRIKAYQIAYNAANAGKVRERQQSYKQANVESYRSYRQKWRAANPDKALSAQHKWRENNPEAQLQYASARRARKIANGVYAVTTREMRRLYTSACIYCGSRDSIHADHVLPLKRGGRHSIGNLAPACAQCNLSKNAKTVMEWRLSNLKKVL